MTGQGVFDQGMVFGLAEPGDEALQVVRRHRLAADQDRAVAVEGLDHAIKRRVVRVSQIDIQNFSAEAGLQVSGFGEHGEGHGRPWERDCGDSLTALAQGVLSARALMT